MNNKKIQYNENVSFDKTLIIDKKNKTSLQMSKINAIDCATEQNCQLIEIGQTLIDNEMISVCIIYSIEKYIYELKKGTTNKNTKEIKTIEIKNKISMHDLNIKINKIVSIIQKYNQIKVVIKSTRNNTNIEHIAIYLKENIKNVNFNEKLFAIGNTHAQSIIITKKK